MMLRIKHALARVRLRAQRLYSLALCLLLLGAATGAKSLIDHVFGQASPYMTYLLAVFVAAWLLGGWWGYLVMIASCVIGVFAFVGPFDLGFVGHHFIFVGEASLIVYALNRMHRAVREAETATRTRDHFMAIVSHDLRNPLSAIHMHVDTILRKDPGNRSALVMHRAVGKMERLIQQMVELVRSLSSGEIPLHIEPVCPKDILEEAIATISPSCPVHVQVEVDQGSTATAYWDRVKVDQIFTNMLTNACKYGGGKPIRVILDVHDVTVQVRVQDEGCGIPHEEKARLFRPYARMSNAKGRDGLGLGLWVTRQLAEMMGGSVEVESEEGRGTVFSVTLPRKVPGHV